VGSQGLIRFVMAQVPRGEGIEDGLRRQVKLFPQVIVRQLVAHALIHQDLTGERWRLSSAPFRERWRGTIASGRATGYCALKWVTSERMADRSLRERFRLPERKARVVSQVIAATIGAGLVRPDEGMGGRLAEGS
jgi:hypothetical protein